MNALRSKKKMGTSQLSTICALSKSTSRKEKKYAPRPPRSLRRCRRRQRHLSGATRPYTSTRSLRDPPSAAIPSCHCHCHCAAVICVPRRRRRRRRGCRGRVQLERTSLPSRFHLRARRRRRWRAAVVVAVGRRTSCCRLLWLLLWERWKRSDWMAHR